jgi:pimeloyl-ACP methyl ester carboxylesterase
MFLCGPIWTTKHSRQAAPENWRAKISDAAKLGSRDATDTGDPRLTLHGLSRYLSRMVRRRHVYHLAGYDPVDCGAQFRRFVRQLEVFKRTWTVEATLSGLERSSDPPRAWWRVNAHAADWQVEAVHEVLLWDDIVLGDFGRPTPKRLLKAALAYVDFIATGTMFRYFRANHRYVIFFLIPLLQVVLFAGAAWFCARLLSGFLGLAGLTEIIVGGSAGLLVFICLLQWPGRRWRVEQMLDDWIFAREYLYGRRGDIDARLDGFARTLVARARDSELDEIVIVGHSLGAMLALDLVDRALAMDSEFGRVGAAVCVLTVGATIPKFALHPAAKRLRGVIARIAAAPSIAWAEYQTRDDIISFYKFDPVALQYAGERLAGKPVIRRVQIHQMLTAQSLSRYRRNYLRLHYQSVMANDRHAPYDYFLMVCGPVSFDAWTKSVGGLLDFVAADGSRLETARERALLADRTS